MSQMYRDVARADIQPSTLPLTVAGEIVQADRAAFDLLLADTEASQAVLEARIGSALGRASSFDWSGTELYSDNPHGMVVSDARTGRIV